MKKLIIATLAWLVFLGWVIPMFVRAQTVPPAEKEKIESLIKQVAVLKDAKFVRNGTAYNADTAATFLRRKWEANQSDVKTARDFIDKVASISGTSRKPYLIRFKDGTEIQSRYFLLRKLNSIEGSSSVE
ncbi:MAG TPA: DUF5329 family protein [Candidatus Udaeobacter sp.]|nr:DUF5329 family protein [Candidatus Udaeobacter sp.]